MYDTAWTDLAHVLEEFLSTPARELPVIVILLGATDAQCSIASRRSTKELSTAQLDLTVIDALSGNSDNVPVCFRIKISGPSAILY